MKAIVAYALLILAVAIAAASSAETAMRADGQAVPFQKYGDDNCKKLAILSPGFGGTEAGLSLFAKALAKQNYLVLVIGHKESGPAQFRDVVKSKDWRHALETAVSDPSANAARFLDLDAIWNMATRECVPDFSVLIGHSMGAQTTIIEAGAHFHSGLKGKDRFNAYVVPC